MSEWIFPAILAALVLINWGLSLVNRMLANKLALAQVEQLHQALRMSHKVNRMFLGAIAETEMTGKTVRVTVEPKVAEAVYEVDRIVSEALKIEPEASKETP